MGLKKREGRQEKMKIDGIPDRCGDGLCPAHNQYTLAISRIEILTRKRLLARGCHRAQGLGAFFRGALEILGSLGSKARDGVE